MNAMMGALVAVAVVELAVALWRREEVHSFRDTISSLALGIGQQAINVYLSAGLLGVYLWIEANVGVFDVSTDTWWHWVLFIPACDLCYYVAHRAMHTVNFFVAAHIVHHQAEDYNHLSAMRQSWTAWIVVFPFFATLAVAGVPLEMFVVGQLGIMFLQFLSHNGLYRGRLGWLDKVFVTPANHRVHHGINGPYLGSNCGGMFVLWDRVFGTYVEEDPERPIVMGAGLRTNFYDPFEANLDYYRRVFFAMKHRRGLGKLTIWLQSPEVLFAELEAHGYREGQPVNREELTRRDQVTIAVLLALCVATLAVHRLSFADNGLLARVATGAAVMLGLWAVGRLLTRPVAVPVAAK
jgi:sterol desaturase/sphingolipid hydroxylase (fatty acid hydroxylase superfamily)